MRKGPAQTSKNADTAQVEEKAKELGLTVLNWDPGKLLNFARGSITLAELDGVGDKEMNDMAEVGYTLLSQGRLEDARKIFAGLAIMNPYEAYYQLALGSIAQRNNEMAEAEAAYSRAIEINPTIAATFANRAETRISQGKLNDAIGDLISSLTLSSTNPNDASAQRARIILNAIQEQVDQLQKKKGA